MSTTKYENHALIKHPWALWNSKSYRDEAFYDIMYKEHVYTCAYPNGNKVSCDSSIQNSPLGFISDVRQETFGEQIMCRPSMRHPVMECGGNIEPKICNKWFTCSEYMKLANTPNIDSPRAMANNGDVAKPVTYTTGENPTEPLFHVKLIKPPLKPKRSRKRKK